MRSHKNTARLTAKERALRYIHDPLPSLPKLEKMLQAHAREAVDRHKRKHGC